MKSIGGIFETYIKASNKPKYIPLIRIFNYSIYIPLFFVGLIFFDIVGAIIGLIISEGIIFIFYLTISIKLLHVNLELRKIIYTYMVFFLSLAIVYFLNGLIL